MSDNFEELFSAALSELTAREPEVSEESTDENLVPDGSTSEETNEVVESVDEVESDGSAEATDKSGPVAVKEDDVIILPDGTEVNVAEAVLRQADYTRKTQQLSEERKAFEDERSGYSEAVGYVDSLKTAWASNPTDVVAGFVSSATDPTLLFTQVLVELAKADVLDPNFLNTFGITPEIREQWQEKSSRSSEIEDVRRRLDSYDAQRNEEQERVNAEYAQQEAIADYERQWVNIKSEFELDVTGKEELELKISILQYASDRGITDLRAAFAAQQYESSKISNVKAAKAAEATDKKRATSAVTSKGTSGSLTAPKVVSSIEDAAWEAFNEITSRK